MLYFLIPLAIVIVSVVAVFVTIDNEEQQKKAIAKRQAEFSAFLAANHFTPSATCQLIRCDGELLRIAVDETRRQIFMNRMLYDFEDIIGAN